MATVHLGRLIGTKGFSRTVAIKQLHAQFAHDAEFAAMFLDEAHLTARIHHPNVVAPLDVIESDGEICIVMEYVHGESLGRLVQLSSNERVPQRIVAAVMIQVLLGLHAAHVATDDHGHPLSIVHRDVSPQNILVGEDGITRVVDFGIAKAARRIHSTQGDKLKGKIGYMSPEQLRLAPIDHRSDLFSAGIIFWELLTGRELFTSEEPAAAVEQMLRFQAQPPSRIVDSITPVLDEVVLKSLRVEPDERYPSAREMARAIESTCPPAGALEVSEWVDRLASTALERRAEWIADIEEMSLDELTRTHSLANSSSPPPPVEQPPADAQPAPSGEPHSNSESLHGLPVDASPRVGSQSPSLVVATSKTPLHPERQAIFSTWRTRSLGLAGVAVVTALVFVLWARLSARHTGVTVTALGGITDEKTEASPLLTGSADSAVASTATLSPAASATLDEPDASTTSVSTDVQTTMSKHTATTSAKSATATQPPRTSAPNCKVPYSVDAQGIKRFRLECFNHPR